MRNSQETIGKVFDRCQDIVVSLDSTNTTEKTVQKNIETAIRCLQDLNKEVYALGLFSGNEDLEEVQTAHLKFLLIPCFLGYLVLNFQSSEDRLNVLKTSQAYFQEFLTQIKSYTNSNFDDEDSAVEGPSHGIVEESSAADNLKDAQRARDRLIKKHKERESLKLKIDSLKAKMVEESDEEIVREFYVSQLKWWTCRAEEEVLGIEREKPIVEHMMKVKSRGGKSTPHSGSSRGSEKKGLKPIILTRTDLEKKVFGVGYPSVPTMTISEWYEKFAGKSELPERGISGQKQSEKLELEKASIDEDEALKRAREWDEYKDDHRRGWGNTKNKG